MSCLLMEIIKDHIDAFITLVVGFIGSFFVFKGKRGDTINDQVKMLLDSMQSNIEGLKKDVAEAKNAEFKCQEINREVNRELATLKASFTLLKASSPNIPIPMWFKDINGVMLSVNDSYEEKFLIPLGKTRDDYIGKTDVEIWGEEIASEFWRNDQEALMSKDPISVFENVNAGKGIFERYNIIKYPSKIADVAVGIAGIALPKPIRDVANRKF